MRPPIQPLQMLIVAFAAAVAWAGPISIGPFFRQSMDSTKWSPHVETLLSASFALPLGLLPVACLFAAWRLAPQRPRAAALLITLAQLTAFGVVFVVLAGLSELMMPT